eukprot:jgi/Orpsp1_1/1183392/evm.model.c7180000084990.1
MPLAEEINGKKIEKITMIDYLIRLQVGYKPKVDHNHFLDTVKFIYNYYDNLYREKILYLLSLKNDNKKISRKNFSEFYKNFEIFVDIDKHIEFSTIELIIYSKNIDFIEFFISYYGIDYFFKSKFYQILEKEAKYMKSDIIRSIDNIRMKELLFENIINIYHKKFKTPLMYAAKNSKNKTDIISLLIKYGANKNYIDKNGMTALHIACQFNNYIIIPYLISENNINLQDNNKNTPLMIALKTKHFNSAIILLSSKLLNINITDKNRDTPLIYLLKNNIKKENIFEELFKKEPFIKFDQLKNNELSQKIKNNTTFIKLIIKYGIYILKENRCFHEISILKFSIEHNLNYLTESILIYYINNYCDDDQLKIYLKKQLNLKFNEILDKFSKYDYISFDTINDIINSN